METDKSLETRSDFPAKVGKALRADTPFPCLHAEPSLKLPVTNSFVAGWGSSFSSLLSFLGGAFGKLERKVGPSVSLIVC